MDRRNRSPVGTPNQTLLKRSMWTHGKSKTVCTSQNWLWLISTANIFQAQSVCLCLSHGTLGNVVQCVEHSPMSAVTKVDWFSGSEMDACSGSASSLTSSWLWLSSERSSEYSSSSLPRGERSPSEVKGLQEIQEIYTCGLHCLKIDSRHRSRQNTWQTKAACVLAHHRIERHIKSVWSQSCKIKGSSNPWLTQSLKNTFTLKSMLEIKVYRQFFLLAVISIS